ncbi:MAG: hypothetical protein IIC50_04330 [Planctomycetes bacterium]|nr:hypothetical protein [Planctomycetota bacterium]
MRRESTPTQQEKGLGKGGIAPPVEHQFKPGPSGNPAGSPKAKTNLYKHIGKYSGMRDAELAQSDLESLTQSGKAARRV